MEKHYASEHRARSESHYAPGRSLCSAATHFLLCRFLARVVSSSDISEASPASSVGAPPSLSEGGWSASGSPCKQESSSSLNENSWLNVHVASTDNLFFFFRFGAQKELSVLQ